MGLESFFFQAEDGIRDQMVTGVQTCALPILFFLIPRFLLGAIVFGEIYFMVLLNYGIVHFNIGLQEFVGAYTVFAFYMYLRVADDFKDYETDKRLFPNSAVDRKSVV